MSDGECGSSCVSERRVSSECALNETFAEVMLRVDRDSPTEGWIAYDTGASQNAINGTKEVEKREEKHTKM